MKLEHIISTMNREEFSFLENMNLQTDAVVVNQNKASQEQHYETQNGVCARVISVNEKGLSRSRNRLLDAAQGDICIVGDDDVEYYPDYLNTIVKGYEAHPDADIIVFRFTNEHGAETRVRYKKDKRYRLMNISKAASVEITFKRKSILDAGVRFNNRIGLGTDFPSGEENAFLGDCLRAGLRIYHVPETICYAVEAGGISCGEKAESYLKTKGAAYYCIYGRMWPAYSAAFVLLKKKTLFPNTGFLKCLQYMAAGKKAYLEAET